VSSYIITALAVGLPSLALAAPDVVAMLRARREDIPAVMQARAKQASPKTPHVQDHH
jgi:hypothetical protein